MGLVVFFFVLVHQVVDLRDDVVFLARMREDVAADRSRKLIRLAGRFVVLVDSGQDQIPVAVDTVFLRSSGYPQTR